MRIATALAAAQTLKVDTRAQKLDITALITGGVNFTPAQVVTALNVISIEVNKQGKNGATPIMQRTPLGVAAVAALGNEGLMRNFASGGNMKSAFAIELSDYGALSYSENEYLELVFTPTTVGGDFDEHTIDIDVIDSDMLSRTHNTIKKVSFDEDTPKPIDVTNVKTIIFPAGTLSKAEIVYPSGTRVTLDEENIKQQVIDGLGINILHKNGSYTLPDTGFMIYNVASARELKLTFNTTQKIYKLEHELI